MKLFLPDREKLCASSAKLAISCGQTRGNLRDGGCVWLEHSSRFRRGLDVSKEAFFYYFTKARKDESSRFNFCFRVFNRY